jgi:hypothetical protein
VVRFITLSKVSGLIPSKAGTYHLEEALTCLISISVVSTISERNVSNVPIIFSVLQFLCILPYLPHITNVYNLNLNLKFSDVDILHTSYQWHKEHPSELMPADKYISNSFTYNRNCNKHHGQVADTFASNLGGSGITFKSRRRFL